MKQGRGRAYIVALSVGLVSLFAIGLSRADLVLNLDPATKTYFFTGTSGEGTTSTTSPFAEWTYSPIGGVGSVTQDISALISFSSPGPNDVYTLTWSSSNPSALRVSYDVGTAGTLGTFTGTGRDFAIDYSSWPNAAETAFEAFVAAGNSIPVSVGTDEKFLAIQTTVFVIPEPSGVLIAGLLLVGGWTFQRRRCPGR